MPTDFPRADRLTIGFAHAAYRLGDCFAARKTGIRFFEVRSLDDLKARANEADVLVLSGLWRNELFAQAGKLRFVQSVSAGVDQYDKAAFAARFIRLASAQGANERAVSEHAIALILAMARMIPGARDNQARGHWRP
ncbi:MAG: D-2-hydroxyacid dehydrogenase, partial [Alphaproteobacteria bacterium]